MFDRVRFLITLKSTFCDVYPHKYVKSKINSFDDFPFEKTLTMFK